LAAVLVAFGFTCGGKSLSLPITDLETAIVRRGFPGG